MATLKIYNDIVGEEDKIMLRWWEGIDGVCFKDIDEFLSAMDEGDNEIDIRIHCKGGDCVEGWAIYDKLRDSKKTISCTVEGECSSMATIILLAAPLERRFAYKNAHFCIHNPALCYPEMDYYTRLTADNLEKNISKLKTQVKSLRDEEQKMLDLYTSRTSATEEQLVELMAKDTYIGTQEAIDMGFISATLSPLTASKSRTFKINSTKAMKKKAVRVEAGVFDRLLAKAGLKNIKDLKMKSLVVTAADGTELTVEREEGDPQVGDAATPDGTFVMEDGTEIVVEDGFITEINAPDEETEETEEEDTENLEELDQDELIQRVEELTTQNEELQQQVEELTSQLNAKKSARVLSSDEKLILGKVAKAGGRQWLEKVLTSKSTFNASNTRFVESSMAGRSAGVKESVTQKAIRERREKAEAKRKARANK